MPICHVKVEQCVAVSKPKLIESEPISSKLSKYARPTVLPGNDINVYKTDKSDHTIIKNILEPCKTQDSSYYLSKQVPESSPTCFKPNTLPDKYSILLEKNTGLLTKAGLSKSNLSPQENIMYQVHRNTLSKLSKLRSQLKNKNADLCAIKNLYNDGKFQFIDENLNSVTKDFINSQLRNVDKNPCGRRWTIKDKAFALSIYKRSPRLYRYLRAFFQLPSIRGLQTVLSSIPFTCGIIKPVLEHLGLQMRSLDEFDRCCTLMFDEMSLCSGLYYERHKQKVCGFEDLGPLGTTSNCANHVLVFMIRDVRKNFKMPVAYYFTKDTIKSQTLIHN